ncbi:hypothetical protein CEXT_29191 [Caerostris extrusa]|uniref:Uncharacterized protein n=1 Tax=Caerostris extrusa TaxID=172846 RepID=A0AAV4PJK2_CAEEX|nr:hypothetical protein CEXT_29191 [Caerostris extrusa]
MHTQFCIDLVAITSEIICFCIKIRHFSFRFPKAILLVSSSDFGTESFIQDEVVGLKPNLEGQGIPQCSVFPPTCPAWLILPVAKLLLV